MQVDDPKAVFQAAVKLASERIIEAEASIPPQKNVWRWHAQKEAGTGGFLAFLEYARAHGDPRVSFGSPETMRKSYQHRVEAAQVDLIAHWKLRAEIAAYFQMNWQIPKEYKDFMVDVMNGTVEEPTPPKGLPAKVKFTRDRILYKLVQYLQDDCGLYPTRNDTSPELSGCDAVAEAWRTVRNERMSYATVQNAYALKPGKSADDAIRKCFGDE
ncbi:hypothetical protein [Celeribacter halophilus]|uniref:hypothetical protein n=1 Tax=Celeribacter halophilus TaxID=576117 RepID=UPI003A8EDEDA